MRRRLWYHRRSRYLAIIERDKKFLTVGTVAFCSPTTNAHPSRQTAKMDPAVQPNTTLYINNLNDKINKEELRTQLYALFATHGKVIDVVATKSPKMRGQAFLVFADLAGATAAMRACAGMTFYDKPLVRDCQPISVVFQVDPTRFPLSFPLTISEPPSAARPGSVGLDLLRVIGIWDDSGYHTLRLNPTRL